MGKFNERLQRQIDDFRDRILTDSVGVLDPEDLHHEFVSGNHGKKLDFDKIQKEQDFDLYTEWVSLYARSIHALYGGRIPDALVGIANGANRLSTDVAGLLGKKVMGLTTVKIDTKTVKLDDEAIDAIRSGNIKFALTIEDVGTTGSTTSSVISELRDEGVKRIESITTWQRNPSLPRLDEYCIPYSSLISEPLPMFSPEDCVSDPEGYCFQGITLIPHD